MDLGFAVDGRGRLGGFAGFLVLHDLRLFLTAGLRSAGVGGREHQPPGLGPGGGQDPVRRGRGRCGTDCGRTERARGQGGWLTDDDVVSVGGGGEW